MEIKAKAKFIRMSPRKVRLVVDIVRGKNVETALNQLKFANKLAAKPIAKLINSGIASAKHNYEIEEDNLYIKEIRVDEGPTLHRWMPKAFGRATPLRKRSSHINLILAEIKDSGKKEAKKTKIDEPIKLAGKAKEDEGIRVSSKKKIVKEEIAPEKDEKGKKIIDPREEGKGGHAKIEGKTHKGFTGKIFRRKSG